MMTLVAEQSESCFAKRIFELNALSPMGPPAPPKAVGMWIFSCLPTEYITGGQMICLKSAVELEL